MYLVHTRRGPNHPGTHLHARTLVIQGLLKSWHDPKAMLTHFADAHDTLPTSASAHFHYARALWLCAADAQRFDKVETHLRESLRLAKQDGNLDIRRYASELLVRMLSQGERRRKIQTGKRRKEAHKILTRFSRHGGPRYTLAKRLVNDISETKGGASIPAETPSVASVSVFDTTLTRSQLYLLQSVFVSRCVSIHSGPFPHCHYVSYQTR